MKCIAILSIAFALSACADMTPREKYWTAAIATAVAVGFVAANSHSEQNQLGKKQLPDTPNCSQPGLCN